MPYHVLKHSKNNVLNLSCNCAQVCPCYTTKSAYMNFENMSILGISIF